MPFFLENRGGMKWKRTTLVIVTINLIAFLAIQKSIAQQYTFVPFYQDTFLVVHQLDPSAIVPKLTFEGEAIKEVIASLESQQTNSVVDYFRAIQEQKKLNDWLLYLLIRKFVAQTFEHHGDNLNELVVYFFLSKLGIKQQLAHENNQLFIYTASEENVFQTPFITIGDVKYYNLTYVANHSQEELPTVYMIPNPLLQGDRQFSFYLTAVPILTPIVDTVHIAFNYDKKQWGFTFIVDLNLKAIFEDHPTFDEAIYLQFPFSPVFNTSLQNTLKPILHKMKVANQLRFLVALTRGAFKYMEDERVFGFTKPLPAEVVFMYPFSDCEDRSALFFQLVNVLTPQPMIVLAYDDHITIGVHIPQFKGDFVEVYKKKFYICDPTGPLNTSTIGVFPSGYRQKPYEVIAYSNTSWEEP